MRGALSALVLVACGGARSVGPTSTLPSQEGEPVRAEVRLGAQVHVRLSGGPGCISSALGEHCVSPDADVHFELPWEALGAVPYDGGYIVRENEPALQGEVQVERTSSWAVHPLGDALVYRSETSVVQIGPRLWRTASAQANFAQRTFAAFGEGQAVLVGSEEADPSLRVVAEGDEATFLRLRYWPGEASESGAGGFAEHLLHRLADGDALEDFAARHLALRHGLSAEPLRQNPRAGWLIGACLGPLEADLMAQLARVDLLDDRTLIDADACLLPWSKRLVAIRYEAASAARLLRVGEVEDTPARIVRGGGFFEAGDVVIEVAGEPVESAGDVAWHVRDLPTGRRFTVRVQRGEQVLRTWARRPRTGERDAIRFLVVER